MYEKTVQELAHMSEGGGQPSLVPDKFICKNLSDSDPAFDDATLPLMNCPVIDLELLASLSEPELKKLGSALASWGCYQVVNHGISTSSLGEMRGVIKQFFELPLEEKMKYSRQDGDPEGYGNDTFVSDDRVLDWMDRLYLITYPVTIRKMHVWPEKPHSLREKLHEFSVKTQEILELTLKAAAKSLDVEDASFLKQYGEKGYIITRFNMYPKCPLPSRVLGLHAHTDASAITIVLPDKQVEGLQVLKDDRWFKVPVNPNALFINIGDQLEIMSNGIFKSPTHRVVTSAVNERISLAMFCCPDPDNEIKPLEELISADRPQMYKMVKNFVEIFYKYYQEGEAALPAVRI